MMQKVNKTMVILLVLALALASIVHPEWLSSKLFMGIYLLFALFLILSIFIIPDIFIKILHLLLAILVISFVMIKISNVRESYVFAEGESYELIADGDSITFTLEDFTIIDADNENVSMDYVSNVIINGKETKLSVNHPISYKRSRFYQSGYKTVQSFVFCTQNDTVKLFNGQSKQLGGQIIKFLEYDELFGKIAVSIDRDLHLISIADTSQKIFILPSEFREASVIEYVEVKGHGFMFVLGIFSIMMLIFIRFKVL